MVGQRTPLGKPAGEHPGASDFPAIIGFGQFLQTTVFFSSLLERRIFRRAEDLVSFSKMRRFSAACYTSQSEKCFPRVDSMLDQAIRHSSARHQLSCDPFVF